MSSTLHDFTAEVADAYRRAAKEELIPREERGEKPVLDRSEIEGILPHRDRMLLVDRITKLDLDRGLACGRYDLARAASVLAGHFPGQPVWPGIFQSEALGQVGLILLLKQSGQAGPQSVALTHVLGCRYIRPVVPGEDVELVARGFEDGLFFTIVGQCLQGGKICSVAAVSTLV